VVARPLVIWPVLLALLAWGASIGRSGFSFDDRELLFDNPVIEGSLPWSDLVAQDYWEHRGAAGLYRPLSAAALRLDRGLWGESAWGYHLTNVILHACVVALACLLCARLVRGRAPWPFLGLALFAVHPALADSVAWIAGRTSMVAALPGLAGALGVAVLAGRTGGQARFATGLVAAAGVLCALLGKEDGIVFALLIVAVARASSRPAALSAAAGAALGLALYLLARHAALGTWLPSSIGAPLGGAPLGERLTVGGATLAVGLRVAVLPFAYPPTWEAADFAFASPALALIAWSALICALLGGARLATRGSDSARVVGGSLCLAAVAVLPLAQLVPLGELLAPRFLYLPLLFAAPFVHACLSAILPARHRTALVGALLALCVVGAWQRSGVYASRMSYWEERRVHQPTSARVWNALGNAHLEQGDRDAAQLAWERAVRLEPGYSRPWTNLATLHLADGKPELAIELLNTALEAHPRNAVAWSNLGNAYLRTQRPEDAERCYEKATQLQPGFGAHWRGLARAREQRGDSEGALEAVRQALARDPGDERAQRLLERLAPGSGD